MPPKPIALLPKAELHSHLDGSLRPQTVIELAALAGIPLPRDAAALAARLTVPVDCASLADYLRCFDLPLALLQEPTALQRVAREYVEDVAAEHVVYAEVRYAPGLSRSGGARYELIFESLLSGLLEGAASTGVAVGFIACTMRHYPAAENLAMMRAATGFMPYGLVGIDLAGDEALGSQESPSAAYALARAAGLRATVHAGEAAGPESVRQALGELGAERIGHGVRSHEDPALVEELARRRICLEMCLTSNLQTRTVDSLAEHPFKRLREQGVAVTLNTDSRRISGVTLTSELELAARLFDLGHEELRDLTLAAVDAGFLSESQRHSARATIEREWGES